MSRARVISNLDPDFTNHQGAKWPLDRGLGRGALGIMVTALHVGLFIVISAWSPSHPRVKEDPIQVSLVTAATEQPKPVELRTVQLATVNPTQLDTSVVIDVPQDVPSPITVAPPPSAETVAPAATPDHSPRPISQVEYLEAPSPHYPPESRRLHEEGLVLLRVLIDEGGHASRVDVEQSSGYPRLDEAAREAVSRALFRPYTESGVVHTAVVTIPVEFALHGGHGHWGHDHEQDHDRG